MQPLSSQDLHDLGALHRQVGHGWALDQGSLDRIVGEWAPRVLPNRQDVFERFAIARPDGTTTGASAPRWVFHLLGLAHRASHVGFATASGLVILQRRASTKVDWPDAWDMAVAGHVPQNPDGSDMSFEDGALKEIEEEVGLLSAMLPSLLVERALTPIGVPYFTAESDPRRNPPFHNAESRQLYAGTLTDDGLAHLRPDEEELSGILLCTISQAWDMLSGGNVASGLRFSLPRYLDWLVRQALESR